MNVVKTLFAATTAAFTLAALPAKADTDYPNKPVKIIVAYQPGQGTDITTRYFADYLSKAMGQAFIVENRGGAGGNIGTMTAARAEPDGYTLTMGTNATHNLNKFLYKDLAFDPVGDFEPVIMIGSFPMVWLTRPDTEFKSIKDVLEKAGNSQGQTDVGMPSTTARLAMELLKERTGAPLFGIPYKGSTMSQSNLIGGEIPLAVDTITSARGQIEGGKLRALAVTSAQESALLPGVPTVASNGVKDYNVIAWNALFAPKGTPKEVITKLNLELQKFLSLPETREKMLSMGLDAGGGTPEDLANFVNREQAVWGPVIKKAGIAVN